MSITVPENMKASGGLARPFLPAIPSQPTAKAAADSTTPRTWSFISSVDGALLPVTCPDWCDVDHGNDRETPTHPTDIWCQRTSKPVYMPVNVTGDPEEYRVLGMTLNVRPFDKQMAQRLPNVTVEVLDEHWIEDLDPDAFEAVIDTLEERVKAMRAAHAELLRVRAEYVARGRQA